MNPDTNHLVRVNSEEEMVKLAERGYKPVPDVLNRAARRKLAGQKEAQVSFTSGGKLSKWAAGSRKAKRKMVKESKRRQRASS